MKKDHVFRGSPRRGSDFVFDAEVAQAFDDMLVRSVPFYQEQQSMIAEIAGGVRPRT
jgi:tRNA (cmo5U34)-methyltransferase